MKQIKKPIKLSMYYIPCGHGYENKKDGFISLIINGSKGDKYSMTVKDRDISIRQLAQYLEQCMEAETDESK